jgi:hypothetical protein
VHRLVDNFGSIKMQRGMYVEIDENVFTGMQLSYFVAVREPGINNLHAKYMIHCAEE